MQIITGEFLILALLVYLSNYIRKRYAVVESLLRGCVVFFPPDKNSKEKTITYVQIDDKFSLKSPFFADTEVLLLVLYLTIGLVSLSFLLSFVPVFSLGSSVAFYMVLIGFVLCIYSLYKQAFQLGLSAPENILGMFYSLIVFFAVSILLNSSHEEIFDFDLRLAVQLFELQATKSLRPYFSSTFSLNLDYFMLTILISLLMALCVFPSFRYLSRFIAGYPNAVPSYQRVLYFVLIISPLLLCTLWVKPMTKSFLEPIFGPYFAAFRIGLVLAVCVLRFHNLRFEVQSMLNQSTEMVKDTLRHPSNENLDNCRQRCRAIATMTWPTAHQSLCCLSVVLFLALFLMIKGQVLQEHPKTVTEPVVVATYTEDFSDESFEDSGNEPIIVLRNATFVREVKKIQEEIAKITENSNSGILENIGNISRSTLVHEVFYRDLCEVALFGVFAAWGVATVFSFSILKFVPSKTKTS
jgi:hypothetical protein